MPDREKVIIEFEDFVKSFSKRDDTYYKGLFVSVLALLKEQERKLESIVCFDNGDRVRLWECPFCKSEVRLVLKGR